ncbi:hypothetical protein NADFUDRAFT_82895 [Nadsonia fulvescens var. elongata DSM 6958]|uniref:Large ribosomal subunit protein bL21m n=1 Tax=Nadsonia fulvescens var. elongata DSM 6958 TaxID=857566 RepID=A0A1E3PL58_9ASCO|nr:hypothetical protein NADFUDRAFT_82895 [Nadsonia fulvescens var. elongata DSM 6958]
MMSFSIRSVLRPFRSIPNNVFSGVTRSSLIFPAYRFNSTLSSNTQNSSNLTQDLAPLKQAPSLAATVFIHTRAYQVTEGDIVRVPANIKEAQVGDVLRLDRVANITSRNHTLSGSPTIDPSVFTIRATVIEKTKTPFTTIKKTKRRCRHTTTTNVKHHQTVLRINQVQIN